jgi:hypothetical protein
VIVTDINELEDILVAARTQILADIFPAIPRDYLAVSHDTLVDIGSDRLFMLANDLIVRRRDDGPYIRDPGSEAPVHRMLRAELATVLWADERSISTSELSAWQAYPITLTPFGTHAMTALARFLKQT